MQGHTSEISWSIGSKEFVAVGRLQNPVADESAARWSRRIDHLGALCSWVNDRYLRIPAGWNRREAVVADLGGGRRDRTSTVSTTCEPISAPSTLRPRRGHGRLDRRAGLLRHGPLRRFQPAQVSGQGRGPVQDHGPDHADGHSADRLPWRLDCGRQAGLHGLRRRRRSRRPRGGRLRPAPGCGCDHDRRHERGAAKPRPKRSASSR